MKKLFCLMAFGLMLVGNLQADLILTNGDFATNDLTGWTPTGAPTAASGAAVMIANQGIRQDFSLGATGTTNNTDVLLQFDFSVSGAFTGAHRIRLRDNNNAGDIATFRINASAAQTTGNAIDVFSGQVSGNLGFQSLVTGGGLTLGTTYTMRVWLNDLDLASRSIQVSINSLTPQFTSTFFHSAAVGSDFETITLEAGATATTFTVDNFSVSAIPEPGALTLAGMVVGAVGFVRRRRGC